MKTKESQSKKGGKFPFYLVKSMLSRRTGRILAIICINVLLLELLSWFVVLGMFKQNYGSIAAEKHEYTGILIGQKNTQTMDRPTEGHAGVWRQLHPFFGYTRAAGNQAANNLGFSSQFTYPYVAQKDEFVIGVFGGSVAYQIHNTFIENCNIIAGMLLPRLSKKGYNRVTILNFACGGYRQPINLFVFLYFLDTIDMAIFIEGFNEIMLNEDVPETYPLDFPPKSVWGVMARSKFSHTTLETIGLLHNNIAGQKAWTDRFNKPVIRHSMFCHILWKLIIKGLARQEAALREKIVNGGDKGIHITNVNPIGYKKKQVIDLYFQRYKRHISTAWHIGVTANVPCIFVLQPNQYLKGSKPYSKEERRKFLKKKIIRARVNRYYPRVKDIYAKLADEGVSTFDATMLFKNTVQSAYQDDCCHFNNLGKEMIFRAIMEKLLNNKHWFDIVPDADKRQGRLIHLF